jgi:hypothetical protein
MLDDVTTATKEVTAELALECWHELAEDLIVSAWDFDDSFTEGANEDINADDDAAFIDICYRHDDLEEIDLVMIVDRDGDK